MNEYYASSHQVRLSDGERKAAVRRLRGHHRRGRIDAIELEERTDAVGFARNRGDLQPVFADLEFPPIGGRRGPWAFRRGWFPLFPVFPLLVIGIVVAATGHVPWVPIVVLAAFALLFATRRRRWGRAGWAC